MNIDDFTKRFNLSPYQTYVLKQNDYKYEMDKVEKIGNIVYAPQRCNIPSNIKDTIGKMLLGPRTDLIGTDKMIASGERSFAAKRILNRYK